MKIFLTSTFLLITIFSHAQFYTNASNNLPANGANGTSMDVQAADIDKDGDLDIILANEFQANTILLNDGHGVFTNGTTGNLPQVIHDSEDIAIADFNGDTFIDIVFCSEDDITLGSTNVHEFYFGNENGNFLASTVPLPDTEANAVLNFDINEDGHIDLLFGNNGNTTVLINDGTGGFVLDNTRIPQINRTTQDLAIADVDGDGDFDLFEGNENGNLLHINDGFGFFSEQSADRLPPNLNIETRKVSFGDIDNDDDQDIFLSNVAFIPGKNRQNRLLLNDGFGFFTDITSSNLPMDNDHTIDAIFEDIDLDNDLDLVVANIFGSPIKIYQNDSTGFFEDQTINFLGQFYFKDALGVIAADFNGDELCDFYICDRKAQNTNNKDLLLINNQTTSHHQISADADFIIFPNPVKDKIHIQFKDEFPKSLQLKDPTGKNLKSFQFNASSMTDPFLIDLSKFPSGVYFMVVKYKNGKTSTKKFMLQ